MVIINYNYFPQENKGSGIKYQKYIQKIIYAFTKEHFFFEKMNK